MTTGGRLPRGWCKKTLGDLCRIKHGFAFKSRDFSDSGAIVLTPGNFTPDGKLDFESKRVVRMESAVAAEWHLENGDLLVVMTDLSQKKLILGSAVILDCPEAVLHNQRIGRVILHNDEVTKPFLRFAILRPEFKKYVDETASGTLIQHTSPKRLCAGVVPLPRPNEQRHIVAKIEALQERSRAAKQALDAIPPLLEKFRQSVLAAAFRGDLTKAWREQHPEVEPASELLKRIRAERRRRWIEDAAEKGRARAEARAKKANKPWTEEDDQKVLERERKKAEKKYKEPEPVDPEKEGLPALPEGWRWVSLSDCGEVARGKSKHRPRNDPKLFGTQYPFIQTGEVARSSGRICRASKHYSEFGLAQSRLFPVGTVCITIAANIADSAVLEIPSCFPDSVVGVVPYAEQSLGPFIELYVRSIRANLRAFAPATAQKNINLAILNQVAVPLPPADELRLIVQTTERALSSVTKTSNRQTRASNRLRSLNASILSMAFRGELVSQEPTAKHQNVRG